jgi:hypothetical protein
MVVRTGCAGSDMLQKKPRPEERGYNRTLKQKKGFLY